MQALKEQSTILDFQTTGDPPDRYTVTLRGKGVSRSTSSHADMEMVDLHRCDVRLPYSYPDRPPDIRWMTPIFHPNISFSGMIRLRDIGLPWQDDLGLDVVVERLWDVARMAYVNEDSSVNYSASNWLAEQTSLKMPVDVRPLADRTSPAQTNVVRYERRGSGKVGLSSAGTPDEVFFIGDDTPTPKLPRRRPPEDDTFYIGFDE